MVVHLHAIGHYKPASLGVRPGVLHNFNFNHFSSPALLSVLPWLSLLCARISSIWGLKRYALFFLTVPSGSPVWSLLHPQYCKFLTPCQLLFSISQEYFSLVAPQA